MKKLGIDAAGEIEKILRSEIQNQLNIDEFTLEPMGWKCFKNHETLKHIWTLVIKKNAIEYLFEFDIENYTLGLGDKKYPLDRDMNIIDLNILIEVIILGNEK